MRIIISIKQLGRKHPYLKNTPLEIADLGTSFTLREFLLAVATQQVESYNQRREEKTALHFLTEKTALHFLTEKAANEQKSSGKVGFGEIYNNHKADLQKAQVRILEAFEDGLFTVFQEEVQLLDLEQVIVYKENSPFTFLRLALLSGSY